MKNQENNIASQDIYGKQNEPDNNDGNKNQKDKKKSRLKYLIYLLLIVIITVVVVVSSLWGDTGEKVFDLFKKMNWNYFAILCGAIIFNFLLMAFILFLFVKLYYAHYKYHQAVANQFVGTFYNGITPGSSGGQVAQIYTFSKQGVSVSSSASVMVMSYIVYQICLITMGIISVATHINDVMAIQTIDLVINGQTIPIPIVIFIILGFGLNLLVIVILFIMSYSTHLHNFISVTLINFLAKIHIVKHPYKTRELVRTQVENFRVEFRRLQSNIPFTIMVILLTFITLWITEMYPFLCGLALNGFSPFENGQEVWHSIFLSVVFTNFHQMITGLIPLPGSSGISEFVFLRLFTGYFTADGFVENGGVNAVMLLWRFMTFHIPFFISGFVAGLYKSRGIPRGERLIASDRKTYLTIQTETYSERKESSDKAYETKAIERKEIIDKINGKKNIFKKPKNDDDNNGEDGNE